ncbi:glucan endo-1,3-beta-glucosidase-like, partial [Quillaja saponaria]
SSSSSFGIASPSCREMAILLKEFCSSIIFLAFAYLLCCSMYTGAWQIVHQQGKVQPQIFIANSEPVKPPPGTNSQPVRPPTVTNSEPVRPPPGTNAESPDHTAASIQSPAQKNDGTNKWCIAKPSATDLQLRANVQHVCQQGSRVASCSTFEYGGPCYNPTNLVSNASVAMNLYFRDMGKLEHTCYFNDSGLIVYEDPSVGNCIYPF